MLKKLSIILIALLTLAVAGSAYAAAITSSAILAKVKAAEAGVKDMRAEMVIESANKGNVSDMGSGYSDILKLQKGVISWKSPDKFRMDGYARGIKASFVQNGYKKLILAAMIRQTEDSPTSPASASTRSISASFPAGCGWITRSPSSPPPRTASSS